MPDQFFEEFGALRGLELERDGELVPLTVLGGRHAFLDALARALDPERYALAPAVARLDLDDAGAHVGQQHGAEGHGDDLPQVEYGDIAQRLVHGLDGGPILARRRVPGQAASRGRSEDDFRGRGW
jgi:GGDEF domain-containing protein